jgi:hypothetical protein
MYLSDREGLSDSEAHADRADANMFSVGTALRAFAHPTKFYNADFPLVLLALHARNEKADLSPRHRKQPAAVVKRITEQRRKK